MAALHANRLAGCAAALAIAAGAQAQDDAPEQIMWSADSWTRSGNMYTIRGPRIEGTDLLVEADEAVTTSLEFSSHWELTGSVHMSVGTARLLADSAVFEFEGGELVAADLSGDPATFEETQPEQAGPVRGEASRLVFDREAGTVQMEGSATFTLGQNSMSGCDFLYELEDGLVSGSSECGVPLSIIYVPQGNDGDEDTPEDDADAAPPQAEPPQAEPPDGAPRAP